MYESQAEMSALALQESVRAVVRREAMRCGSVDLARASIARRHRVSAGSLESAERGRTKRINQRIVDIVIEEITNEWKRLEHEATILKAMGTDPRLPLLPKIEEQLSILRDMMRKV